MKQVSELQIFNDSTRYFRWVLLISFCSISVYNLTAQSNKKNSIRDTSISNKYFREGATFYDNNEYSKAIISFNNAIKHNPDNYYFYQIRATTFTLLHQFEDATKDYTYAINLNPKDLSLYRERAELREALFQYDSAIVDLTKLINYSKKITDEFLRRAFCYRMTLKHIEAFNDIQTAIKLAPNNLVLFSERGMINFGLKKYNDAINDFNKYLLYDKKKNIADVYYYRGLSYLYLDDNQDAIKDLEKVIEMKPIGIVYSKLGVAYRANKDTIKSRTQHLLSIDVDPNNAMCYYDYSMSEYVFGNCKKAKELMNKYYDLVKNKKDVNYFHSSGLIDICLNDTINALKNFNLSLEIDSSDYRIYTERVKFLFGNNKYAPIVLHDLSKLTELSIDTNDKAQAYNLRAIIKIDMNDTVGVENDLNSFLKLSKNKAVAYYNLAFYYYMFKDSASRENKVIELLTNSLQHNKSLWDTYKFLSLSYLILKDNSKKACEVLEDAKSQAKGYPLPDEFKKLSSLVCSKRGNKNADGIFINILFSDKVNNNDSKLIDYLFQNKKVQTNSKEMKF